MSNYYEGIPFGSKIGRGRRKNRSLLPLVAALVVAVGVLYLFGQQVGGILAGGTEPDVVPSPGPRAAVVVESTRVPAPVLPTYAPSPTATPSPPPSPTPAPTPAVMQVADTGGIGVYMRKTPLLDERIRAWVDGTRMTLVGPDEVVGNTTWRHVKDPQGNEGWVPAQYLVPEPAEPQATPPASAG